MAHNLAAGANSVATTVPWPHDRSVRVRPAHAGDAMGIGLVHVKSWQAAYSGLVPHAALSDEVLDRLTSEHPLAGATPKLGGVLPWHIWLLVNMAKLPQGWSTFSGQGHVPGLEG